MGQIILCCKALLTTASYYIFFTETSVICFSYYSSFIQIFYQPRWSGFTSSSPSSSGTFTNSDTETLDHHNHPIHSNHPNLPVHPNHPYQFKSISKPALKQFKTSLKLVQNQFKTSSKPVQSQFSQVPFIAAGLC